LSTKKLRHEYIDRLSPTEQHASLRDWPIWLRGQQIAPPGDWRTWLMLGGRGGGKTRAGAEWISAIAEGDPHVIGDSGSRVALIGETFHDVRSVMIEGESGVLAVGKKDRRPIWHASKRLLEWPNGTIGQVFSATDPDGLRGSQFGAAWCDGGRGRCPGIRIGNFD
jgi:phage terminase large subunit-like protein